MKALKAMSIIGVIIYASSLILRFYLQSVGKDVGGVNISLYGLALSIVGLVQANKVLKKAKGN
jgi:hypothetical protein